MISRLSTRLVASAGLVVLLLALPGLTFDTQPVTPEQKIESVKAAVAQRAAADDFAGTILVARNGTPLLTAAYGLADRERNVPNTLETRFRVGSMNKMFTAVAVLTLVESGKLALEEPIATYLPDYPNRALAAKVTVHHLLTHTGGTGDIFGPQFSAHRATLRSHRDYLNLYGSRELRFEPGARWEYSNYGYILLGAIIERVSEVDYYEYVQRHVYEPAGMVASGSEPEEHAVPDRAVGYTRPRGTDRWIPNTATLSYRGSAAGGGYATVRDLLRFSNALSSGKLLTPETTTLMTSARTSSPIGGYGYGFADAEVAGRRWFGHNGGAPGMNGELMIFPESGHVIAVLANTDPPAASRMARFIAAELFGR